MPRAFTFILLPMWRSVFYHPEFDVPCFTIPDYLFRVPYSGYIVLRSAFIHSGIPCFTTTRQSPWLTLNSKYSQLASFHIKLGRRKQIQFNQAKTSFFRIILHLSSNKLVCNNLGNESRSWKSGEFCFRFIFRHIIHLVW